MVLNRIKSLFIKPKLYGVRPEAMEEDYPSPETPEAPPFNGKWAVLSYFVPAGLMHPEDQERYINGKREGESLFNCTEEEEQWVKITNNKNEVYRVNPKRVIWVPPPEFELYEEVQTTNGTPRVGWVSIREWHFKKKRFIYYIEIINKNGKRVRHKRRYWTEDLERKNS